MHIKRNGTEHVLKFQVIQDKCKPLLSAETCETLQLIQLNVQQLNDIVVPEPLSKEELMGKFHDVFNGLGHIGDAKITKLSDVSSLRELTANQAQFTWARQHDEAFVAIQHLVIQHPVLKFYDVEEEVTIQTDASNKGL